MHALAVQSFTTHPKITSRRHSYPRRHVDLYAILVNYPAMGNGDGKKGCIPGYITSLLLTAIMMIMMINKSCV